MSPCRLAAQSGNFVGPQFCVLVKNGDGRIATKLTVVVGHAYYDTTPRARCGLVGSSS